ncbi:helicase C-terminal domain-containing protein [Planotetraspora sp. A-T 1434]|uniref:helicase C-terminal domain-containing protein n=1 Tax=Planotetraspora sp. A-T 1434 TaxID=2979219 RepID=UPI0021BE8F19|nr:helicase C-terminal domain-containing protein [Planotetraspora sp. A-T 1434]MCT9933299.1 helicase C-terminal domain-containing protein [Planotetraspora sp. A-T 1434]
MSTDFTEWLRGRTDERLRALVKARPELITPVPAHVEGLAARASTPSALGRALDRLDGFTLAVLETLSLQPGPLARDALRALLAHAIPGTTPGPDLDAALDEAIERLRTTGLAYGPDDALRPAPGVKEALDPPAGLGPPAAEVFRHHSPEALAALLDDIVPDGDAPPGGDHRAPRVRLAEVLADPSSVGRLVAEVSPQARAALDELAWGPASGRLPNARREVSTATAQSPIEQLLARGLLGATGEETVALPREVALFLRDGRIHRDLSPWPPELEGATRDQVLADRTAAGQAFTFVRTVEELCEHWSVDPPGVLRTGGLAVRDLKRTAQLLDLPEWAAGLVVEVAHAAGLIASNGSVDGEWLPTGTYDGWRVKATEDRWAVLASAWAAMDRVPGLIGERDERDRPLNALHPDLRRPAATQVRAETLAVLASAGAGLAPAARSVLARLAWERPRRRGAQRDRFAEFTLREAEHIGVTGLGVLSAHGRSIVLGDGEAARLLAPLLPEPVDHVLLQADLTAVAPGPLTSDLGRWLALAADVESKGGATVYRFGERSIRRALDAGQSADDMIAMLERHSATPVPQPLRYLVSDVARRHGRIKVGTASAYVRCDDPSVLDEVLADKRSGLLRLRRLAPTVLASKTSRATLVDSLRAMGYAPVAESLDGDVLVSRAETRRTEGPAMARATGAAGPDSDVVAAAVRAIRAGDDAHRTRRRPVDAPDGQPPRSPASATIEALREAIRMGSQVWIGYLDSQGHATSRILEPARIEGGYLTAYDETRATVHRFALHRITGVASLSPQ